MYGDTANIALVTIAPELPGALQVHLSSIHSLICIQHETQIYRVMVMCTSVSLQCYVYSVKGAPSVREREWGRARYLK